MDNLIQVEKDTMLVILYPPDDTFASDTFRYNPTTTYVLSFEDYIELCKELSKKGMSLLQGTSYPLLKLVSSINSEPGNQAMLKELFKYFVKDVLLAQVNELRLAVRLGQMPSKFSLYSRYSKQNYGVSDYRELANTQFTKFTKFLYSQELLLENIKDYRSSELLHYAGALYAYSESTYDISNFI